MVKLQSKWQQFDGKGQEINENQLKVKGKWLDVHEKA